MHVYILTIDLEIYALVLKVRKMRMRESSHLNHSLNLNNTVWLRPYPRVRKMAGLRKYFKPVLPSKESTGISEAATKEANAAVKEVLEEKRQPKKRKYQQFTPEQRAKIGKYAAENSNASAVRKFSGEFEALGESTVRMFKKAYLSELSKGGGQEVEVLPKKKRGRPLTLGELDGDVQRYLGALRKAGTPVNAKIARAAAKGIVKAKNRALLYENGGHIQLTTAWAYSLLKRMGYVKRKASTKTKSSLSEQEFLAAKAAYLGKIKRVVTDCKIPPQLIMNWDQSGVNVVPSSQWTLAPSGSTRVEIAGFGDKRQITLTIAGTLSGYILPFQILYEGKTEWCHPAAQFPSGFDVWHTPNHWANEETTLRYIEKIILPYVSKARAECGVPEEQIALVIFDVFKGHTGEAVKTLLEQNNIVSVLVPANCTDLLQPLDLSVNKPLKDHLRSQFADWYSDQVAQELSSGNQPENIKIDTRLSVFKPLGVNWLTSAYDYFVSHPEIIINGFHKAGINEDLLANSEVEDPFKDLD